MRNNIVILLLAFFLFSCAEKVKEQGPVITLTNGTVEIKLLPAVGGTLVSASLSGHQNILHSDSTQWDEPADQRPTMDPGQPWKAYNGMIVWLSPQSEWWVKQDAHPELKDAKAPWPPDPYLTSSAYKVVKQSKDEITLEGPESPYTHMQFTKNFKIEGNKIFISVSARNCSDDTLSWGLWFNTRMNGWDKVYVPADSSDLIKTQYMNPQDLHLPELKYADGYFSYAAVEPLEGQRPYKSKSFLSVDDPVIIGNKANQWLIIRSEKVDKTLIHPEQGRIEIYVENSSDKANDLQELEMHFPYEKIPPGASIHASEIWEIIPDPEGPGDADLSKDLKVMVP
ncbi:MAG TPA: DUF4380 domain-containing protein [Prolixibacteraceae bacterium]|nr:DUF4380 domain-containing protein [Prolixibacteraceae bacterium]